MGEAVTIEDVLIITVDDGIGEETSWIGDMMSLLPPLTTGITDTRAIPDMTPATSATTVADAVADGGGVSEDGTNDIPRNPRYSWTIPIWPTVQVMIKTVKRMLAKTSGCRELIIMKT